MRMEDLWEQPGVQVKFPSNSMGWHLVLVPWLGAGSSAVSNATAGEGYEMCQWRPLNTFSKTGAIANQVCHKFPQLFEQRELEDVLVVM